MKIIKMLRDEFDIKEEYLKNIIELIDGGNTIPFIARYRKELTGSLDDQILRELNDRLRYIRSLEERKETVEATIEELGELSDKIKEELRKAKTLTEVEDIYRPYKPKKRTRASIAKEKGLEKLSEKIVEQKEEDIEGIATEFISEEKGLLTIEDCIKGSLDIIAEKISDDVEIRKMIRKEFEENGIIESGVNKKNDSTVYEMYYDYSEPIKSIADHRILAINRGEKEKVLKVLLNIDVEKVLKRIEYKIIIKNSKSKKYLEECIKDSYHRLIAPSIEREIRSELFEKAEKGAIKVFGENLTQLLLQRPLKDKIILSLDPAYRTGCKIAVISGEGKVLETCVVYPTPPRNEVEKAEKKLIPMIEKYGVDVVAIGNGTASRESEKFTAEMLKKIKKDIKYVVVNEAGASVYSASKLGAEEFPDFDVALRSAVSIGRRIQDPLAELVKIDPKSIGVGQYQHDMNQKKLNTALGEVVESAVNKVGVNLNTASPALLSYVSGISKTVARNIFEYREKNEKIINRKELLKVSKVGAKSFTQCAGFLRIQDGDNPLDNTGVHPESYKVTKKLLEKLGFTLEDIRNKKFSLKGKSIDYIKLGEQLEIGKETLMDIVKELEKPGLDPRDSAEEVILSKDVLTMEDLKEGMLLKGTVRNVIDFGAFVDIGVHQDGLVHISEICDKFIKHPLDVLKVGDIVKVKVLSVDINKNRIQLTMKL